MCSILIYTVATEHQDSIRCTTLLYKSLCKFFKCGFGFKIITPKCSVDKLPDYFNQYLQPVEYISDSLFNVFKLKYTKELLNDNYDYYLYLDSDILWLYNNFVPSNAIYTEGSIFKKEWSRYWTQQDKDILLHTNINYQFGINAGFFSLNKQYAYLLFDFMNQHLHINLTKKTRFIEQNMFNLFMYRTFITNSNNADKIKILTNNFVNHANGDSEAINNKVYHFNDKMCKMDSKFQQMTNFLNRNNIVL